MGTLMVPLPALLRGQIGRVGAFAAATALAFGPSFLYYSRFAREDIYVACITLALLVVTFRFLQRPRRHQPALIGILLALSFATKESTFITVFVAGTFFLVALAIQARRHGFREAPIVAAVRAVGWEAWIWGVVAFVAVFTVLFTVFLTNPAGLWDGIHDGIAYWLDQHETGGRGEKEWWFYIVVLFAEEWPALLLGLVGAIVTIRRPTLLRAFLIWDFLVSLALYSYASERFSWLVLHPCCRCCCSRASACRRSGTHAGGGPGSSASSPSRCAPPTRATRRGGRTRRTARTRASSSSPRSRRRTSRRCATRSRRSRRAPAARAARRASSSTRPRAPRSRGRGTSATSPAGYLDMTDAPLPSDTDVAILTEANRNRLQRDLAGYDGRRFPFRVWWVRDYGAMSSGGWWRWMTEREPWNPTGGMREWIYIRQGA